MPPIDIAGMRFGRLTAVGMLPKRHGGRRLWAFRCDCGNVTEKARAYVTGGNTRSCGCLLGDVNRARLTTHGGTTSREYRAWLQMIQRCENPNQAVYRYYGGRGVRVAPEWRHDFAAFLSHVGPCPSGFTLDRIDFNGDYKPGNVRWASWDTQRLNKRKGRGTPRKHSKQRPGCSLSELERVLGISRKTITDHYRRGKTLMELAR